MSPGQPTAFFKVRSLKTGRYLSGSKGFYGSSTTYDTKAGAKSGFTHYKQRNQWHEMDPAEIVTFSATETATEALQ